MFVPEESSEVINESEKYVCRHSQCECRISLHSNVLGQPCNELSVQLSWKISMCLSSQYENII